MGDTRIDERRRENPFVSQVQLAHDLICEDIVTGLIQPGEKIQQDKLAKQFNMSRSPIRDALVQLEQERYVQQDAAGSYHVCSDDVIDYFEYWLFRVNMEQFAAYHAARNIHPDQVRRLRANVRRAEACAEADDARGFLQTDEDFHLLIAEASDNRYVLQWMKDNLRRMTMYRYRFANLPIVYSYSLQKHRKILAAVIEHDDSAARKAMRQHLEVARMRGLQNLSSFAAERNMPGDLPGASTEEKGSREICRETE